MALRGATGEWRPLPDSMTSLSQPPRYVLPTEPLRSRSTWASEDVSSSPPVERAGEGEDSLCLPLFTPRYLGRALTRLCLLPLTGIQPSWFMLSGGGFVGRVGWLLWRGCNVRLHVRLSVGTARSGFRERKTPLDEGKEQELVEKR